ncbi:MAG TPA: MlaD family protein [Solirubrobacteraceae bacterium]|nr:MlaD family protein [Solirubrobacteraceae bacterium]
MISLRTPRHRAQRRRRDTTPPGRVMLTAAISTAVVVGLVALALSIYNGEPWVNYKTINVTVPQTGNLLPHDPVRIAGVRVGQVSGISIDKSGDARLSLQIDPGTNLPHGTTFQLRANGLLGSRYVQLIPGTGSGQLAAGTTLRGNADSLTYGIPDALNVFDQQTRGALGSMVSGLGRGFVGRGPGVNQMIHEIASESSAAQQLVAGLVGPGRLGRLIPSLQSLMVPLDTARFDITNSFDPASASFQPFVDQRTAVQAALSDAPGALSAANAGLSNGERLLAAADTLSIEAARILPTAPAGLAATTTLLRDSHLALARTRTLLATAQPTIPAVLRMLGALQPVLPPGSQALGRGTTISDGIAPYACNIENFGSVLRSMTGFGGAAGVPGGPGGPAMAFRLEVIPASPTEILGVKDFTGLVKRVGYSPPCHYLSTTYPTNLTPTAGLGGQN